MIRMSVESCCGNCKFNKYDRQDKQFYCNNEAIYEYGLPTQYTDCCDDFERKDDQMGLTILFSIFAIFSLWGAASDDDASTRKNLAYCFIVSILAIVAINIF